jgi:hypothetical protein
MADGAPHLSSPQNLPPGTTSTPTDPQTKLSYLRDLWHAMRTQEVSGGDALLLLTQRPMTSAPAGGMPAGPQPAPAALPAPGAPAAPGAEPGPAVAPAPAGEPPAIVPTP